MRLTARSLASVSMAALLVAGGAAGCSGGSGGSGGGASTTASGGASSGAGGTASAASPSPTAPAVEAPSGTSFVQGKSSGMQFAVPQDWKVLDPTTLVSDPESAIAKKLVKTYGVSADQLAKVFGAMDLMVLGPAKKSFAPNVNVVPNPLTALPPAKDLAAELGKIGAKTGTPRDATTPLGPAVVVPYSLQSGTNLVQGRSIVLKAPKGYVTITVSDVDAKAADAVTKDILATASPAPAG